MPVGLRCPGRPFFYVEHVHRKKSKSCTRDNVWIQNKTVCIVVSRNPMALAILGLACCSFQIWKRALLPFEIPAWIYNNGQLGAMVLGEAKHQRRSREMTNANLIRDQKGQLKNDHE